MIYSFSGYEVDTDQVEVRHEGEKVHAEPQVFEVLRYLIERRERVVTKIELLDEIWGGFVSEAALTSRIKSVRQLFGDSGRAQRVVRTVHGKGYQFIADVVEQDAGAAGRTSSLPTGTITFLVTDVERSSWLWEHMPDATRDALGRHDELVRASVEAHDGFVYATSGSGISAGFRRASDAVAAARQARAGLDVERWPGGIDFRVRLGLHTGEAVASDGEYLGQAPSRAAAVLAAAHGGQTLVSDVTAGLVTPDVGFRDLGMCQIDPGLPAMRLWQLDGPSFPAPMGAIASALPGLRTELVGRDDALDRVVDAVSGHRLVSIVGPGGAGKTTLALAAANSSVASFSAGVVFVELASARDDADMMRAIAETAGVEGAAATDARSLATHLARRPLLLVLDNCEHLIDDCGDFVDLVLDSAGTATVVTTSREPLGVDGELLVPLGSLEHHAPELFVRRAAAIAPDTSIDPADERIVDLCARLDGLPLAIELAAAQLNHLGLDDLLARLSDTLRLSGGGRSRGRDRHSNLERTIEWSYELLDDDGRALLRRFGVFPGSFDLAAAESVGEASLSVLSDLVTKNLMVHDAASGRYRLLETIRAFASDRLAEAGEAEEAAGRLVGHVVEQASTHRRVDRWFSASNAAKLRADLDNARFAFDRLLDAGDVVPALEIAIACSYLFRTTLNGADGRRWVGRLEQVATDLAAEDQLWFQILRADLAQGSADHATGHDAAVRAAHLAAQSSDAEAVVIALHLTGLHLVMPDPRSAADRFAEAEDAARRCGDARLERLMRAFGAMAALSGGDIERGVSAAEAVADEVTGDGYDVFIAHWAAWTACLLNGDIARLRHWTDRQRAFLLGAGVAEPWLFLWSVALLHAMEGDGTTEDLRLARERAHGEGHQVDADIVLALAVIERARGNATEAAELLGATARAMLNNLSHYVLSGNLRAALRAELGDDEVRSAMADGAQRNPAEILDARGLALVTLGP